MALDRTDENLISLMNRIAIQDADAALALKELYDICSSRLYGLAVKVTGNREWAEDVLQEAFINIWRIAGDYRSAISPPMAWMGVIVRSRGLDFLRRRTSSQADKHYELDEYIQETVAGDSADPMDSADASEQVVVLRHCLQQLEARQREVVSLAYLRDLSHSELAQQLQLPLGTVKTWIRRGLEQLRICMGRVT